MAGVKPEQHAMTPLRHSTLNALSGADSFFWATGIEDTFITEPWPATGRTLDEYELTEHYERWHSDIGLMTEIGVTAARYGIPWHRIQPDRGTWEWDFVDQTVDRLLELGVQPIIDLVHYGLPRWIDGAFLNADFPQLMAEYAAKVAARLEGRAFAYTPLNEPRITALYCGRLGWWPPFQRGWRGFVRVMLALCRGIIQTVRSLRDTSSDVLVAHVDATDLYRTDDPSLQEEAARRQEIVFLALDLVSGRVGPSHPLHKWLTGHGASDNDLAWFSENAVDIPLVGINLYPMFTQKVGRRTGSGARWTMPYASAGILDALGEMYWRRYGAPVFVSETASVGTVTRRRAWLNDSVAAVRRLRSAGVPIVGYTWWPLFALVTWAYRQGHAPPEYYLKQMGLWDLDSGLSRVRTPLVDDFAALARGGNLAVGSINSGDRQTTESNV